MGCCCRVVFASLGCMAEHGRTWSMEHVRGKVQGATQCRHHVEMIMTKESERWGCGHLPCRTPLHRPHRRHPRLSSPSRCSSISLTLLVYRDATEASADTPLTGNASGPPKTQILEVGISSPAIQGIPMIVHIRT